jgi:hypothetical protein
MVGYATKAAGSSEGRRLFFIHDSNRLIMLWALRWPRRHHTRFSGQGRHYGTVDCSGCKYCERTSEHSVLSCSIVHHHILLLYYSTVDSFRSNNLASGIRLWYVRFRKCTRSTMESFDYFLKHRPYVVIRFARNHHVAADSADAFHPSIQCVLAPRHKNLLHWIIRS